MLEESDLPQIYPISVEKQLLIMKRKVTELNIISALHEIRENFESDSMSRYTPTNPIDIITMILLRNENFTEVYKTIYDKLEEWHEGAGVLEDPDIRMSSYHLVSLQEEHYEGPGFAISITKRKIPVTKIWKELHKKGITTFKCSNCISTEGHRPQKMLNLSGAIIQGSPRCWTCSADGFVGNYFRSSLTKDIVKPKTQFLNCYRSSYNKGSVNFHFEAATKRITCGTCYLIRNPDGMYDDQWNLKPGCMNHMATKSKINIKCKVCKERVVYKKLVWGCRLCHMRVTQNKEELVNNGFLKINQIDIWTD